MPPVNFEWSPHKACCKVHDGISPIAIFMEPEDQCCGDEIGKVSTEAMPIYLSMVAHERSTSIASASSNFGHIGELSPHCQSTVVVSI